MQQIKQIERERRRTQSNYTGSFHKSEVVLSPLHFQGEFTKNVISDYNFSMLQLARDFKLLKHNCKRFPMLLNTIKRLPMLKHNYKRLLLLKHTSKRFPMLPNPELQRSLFDFEHLIYNQWCSQYISDTNS